MTEPIIADGVELDVTPFRLGEMYINLVTSLVDMLMDGEHAMAAENRSGIETLLAPIPNMDAHDLQAFIAGATLQVETVLDALAENEPHADTNLEGTDSNTLEPGTRLTDETRAVRTRLERALGWISRAETRERGFTELGACDFDLHDLLMRLCTGGQVADQELVSEAQRLVEAVLGGVGTQDLTMFVTGRRYAQVFSHIRG